MNAEVDREHEAQEGAPGAELSRAREGEKLSVAEVARHLKLSVAQVEALEAGEFDRLPGPVFVRGFVRNYARLLKLDPDALLRRVEPELSPQPLSPETPPSRDIPFPPPPPRRWPYLLVLAGFVVTVLALYEFYWTEPIPAPAGLTAPTRMPDPTPPPAAPEPVAAPAPVTADPGPAPQAVAAVPDAAPALPAKADKAAPQPQPLAAAPFNTSGAPDAAVLRISFADESWVEIRDRSGNIIFSQLNPPGTEKRIEGEPPLALVIGNAHGVRLTYNDRPVDLAPHTKVDVARFVLE